MNGIRRLLGTVGTSEGLLCRGTMGKGKVLSNLKKLNDLSGR